MEIKQYPVTVRELVKGYKNTEDDGVVGYDGKLDIRPAYQREFVYKEEQAAKVIDTIFKGLPLNVMYWAKNNDGTFEMIDGQQRTISICEYINGGFAYKGRYYHNLCEDEVNRLLDYELFVYTCDGYESEKLDWFRTINISGEKLTEQELLNATYRGPWLSDAKKYFSKNNCIAQKTASDYMNGSPIRQDYLATVLDWISDGNTENYMAKHAGDPNAAELFRYFNSVITWIETVFTVKRTKLMKGLPWGHIYNKFKDFSGDTNEIEKEIQKLILDDDVTNKRGIYQYILDRNESHLSIRKFSDAMKMAAYEKQKGICPICGEHFEYDEMDGDHIKCWRDGGKTVETNLQMLCKKCNCKKGKK